MACSATPHSFRVFRPLDKYVVSDGIPGVMNADEEQQQRRRSNAK